MPLPLITGGPKLPGGNAGGSALDVGPSDPLGADMGLSIPGVTGLGEGAPAMPLLLNVGFEREWQGEELIVSRRKPRQSMGRRGWESRAVCLEYCFRSAYCRMCIWFWCLHFFTPR